MFKKGLLIGLFFCYAVVAQNGYSSFLTKIDSLKKQNNLAEYIYVHLDEFSKKPSPENLVIFDKLSTSIWRTSTTKTEATALIYFYINYGYYLKEFGNFNKAIENYEKGLRIYQNSAVTNYDIIEYCLKPLANCYTRIGEIERAEDVLKVTIEKAQKENKITQVVATYLNLSALLRTKGDFKNAILYLNLALKLSDTSIDKSRIYSDLGILFLELNDSENAQRNIMLSNKFNSTSNVSISVRNDISTGLLNLKVSNLSSAEKSFLNALKKAKGLYGDKNREVAKIYVQLAETNRRKKEFKKAQINYQNALKSLVPNYNPASIYINPVEALIYPENTLKDIFDNRAATFLETNDFEEALLNFDLSFKVEDELKMIYLTQNAKLIQQQENRKRSEKCIEICYYLYEESLNIKWLEKALNYAERTKNSIVVEANEILKNKSKIGNDTIFNIEEKLNLKRAQLNSKIIQEQLKGAKADINLLAKLTKERNENSTNLQLIKSEILNKYPNLAEIKKLENIQQLINSELLSKNTALVEFFDGSNYLYKFTIKRNKPIELERIEKNERFKKDLNLFLDFFADGRGTKLQNDIKTYKSLGYKFYELFFNNLNENHLILIPDGLLNFVPFDALLTGKTTISNFEKLPYLIHKYKITNAFSATYLLQNVSNKNRGKSFVGFFPVFEKNIRNLSELSYTLKEASSIKKYLDGEYYLKENALKQNFEELASNYDIIHLSTHATAGSYYEPPAIEFYDKTLYLPEIYGYNLQSDLVVLSACESGIGALSKGEGTMSLARGFSYAGVKNLIVSLWKVNDKATELLMAGFYDEFSKTDNKSHSLQNSKLNYLKDENITASKKSPYYWASFIYVGSVDVKEASNYDYWWFIIGIFVIGIAVYLFKKGSFNPK